MRVARFRSMRCFLAIVTLAAPPVFSATQATPGRDLTELQLEDLLSIEVTSVARKEQRLSDTTAAVYVITREDLRRSAATSIPEALRMVPGLHVAQIDSSKWAISARGFNARYSNKMLVLIDGRTVYTPLYSGVYWDAQDVLLEDVERIEIIRGPGATLWGANAVNGVINIITRGARETEETFVAATGGSEERPLGVLRYGNRLGSNASYRVHAKYSDRAPLADRSGGRANDQWDTLRGGFRFDWEPQEGHSVSLHGEFYDETADQRLTTYSLQPPYSRTFDDRLVANASALVGQWRHPLSPTSDVAVQVSYDRSRRKDALLGEIRETSDIDFQHQFEAGERTEIVWGLGFRYTADRIDNTDVVTFGPRVKSDHVMSAFLQSDFALHEDFRLTVGSKFEHNGYSGFEVQPNVRGLWKIASDHRMWAAVSRAVRTPSRAWHDVRINLQAFPNQDGSVSLVAAFGDSRFRPEELIAYEAGYRWQPTERLGLDVATFVNDYDRLLTAEPGAPFGESDPPPAHIVLPLVFDNRMYGRSSGFEVVTNWRVLPRWSLFAGYSLLDLDLTKDPSSASQNPAGEEGNSPRQQIHLRSHLDLPRSFALDTAVYYVDRLPNLGVPSYVRVDARVGWRPLDALEASVGVRNLLDRRHAEFGTGSESLFAHATEVRRSLYARIAWRF